RRFDSDAAGGKPLSGDLVAFEGATRSAVLVEAPSSVGAHADASTECTAGDCLGEWSTARPLAVEPRRTKHDRVIATDATYSLSAERVASAVCEVRGGDRETKPASRGASLRTSRSTAVDDASRSGAGHGVGDGGVPGRCSTIRRQ